jgi:hypothetical protein
MITALGHIVTVLDIAVKNDAISKRELRDTFRAILGELDDGKYLHHFYAHGEEPIAVHALNDAISQRFQHVVFPNGIGEGEE